MSGSAPKIGPGASVYLADNPGRTGIVTNTPPKMQAGHRYWRVSFPDGLSSHPEFELRVADQSAGVWELLERGEFGHDGDLRRNLNYMQLSGRLANIVYSMDVTNTKFFPYQFRPVLALLESPSSGLLIADEVGLGKTIEAGLIWTELRSRFDARRLVVMCPAMLREKWQRELREKFGLDPVMVGPLELLEQLRIERREVPDGKAFICSMQGTRPPPDYDDAEAPSQRASAKLARFLKETGEQQEPLIDLLVIDEAHNLRNPGTATHTIGRLLRSVSDHMVAMSATPINLKSEDLRVILELVDPMTFDNKAIFPQLIAANAPLVEAKRRIATRNLDVNGLRTLLLEAASHYLLRDSKQLARLLDSSWTDADLAEPSRRAALLGDLDKVNLLRGVINRTRKRDTRAEDIVIRDVTPEFVPLTPLERSVYAAVTDAVRKYAEDRNVNDGFLLASPQRQVSSCIVAALNSWSLRAKQSKEQAQQDFEEQLEEDFGVDDAEVERKESDTAPLIEHMARRVLPGLDLQRLMAEDSKYRRLREILVEHLGRNPTEKVVLFSFFRGTLEYLEQRLAADGIRGLRIVGGMAESKQEQIDRFRDDPSFRILLSSEVAAEGVDLQFCRFLINYDLPWNPTKIEQRIGRIDRIGQEAERIMIWNLGHKATIDERIYHRLFERLKIFQEALGDTEAILGEVTRQLTVDLLNAPLTPEQEEAKIDQAALAIQQNRLMSEQLDQEAAALLAHSDYILRAVEAARQFNNKITDDDLIAYVHDYLAMYHREFRFLRIDDDRNIYEIQLPASMRLDFDRFTRDAKLIRMTRLGTGDCIRCEFTNRVAARAGEHEIISQLHPLIRFITKDLRGRAEAFHPLVAVHLRDPVAVAKWRGVHVFKLSAWTLEGARSEERLVAACRSASGVALPSDEAYQLVNLARGASDAWTGARDTLNLTQVQGLLEQCDEELLVRAQMEREAWNAENADRVDFLIKSAQAKFGKDESAQLQRLESLRAGKRGASVIRAAQGRLDKIRERRARRIEELQRQARATYHARDVCYGVIRVD